MCIVCRWIGMCCLQCDEKCSDLCNGGDERCPLTSQPMSTRNIQLVDDNTRLRQENERLSTRLSEIASAKMSDNNPDIVDLSDVNRPDKLADRYSEIYDNQWTDAFDSLKKNLGKNDEEAVQTLLHILMTSYKVCRSDAQSQLTGLDCFGGKEIPIQALKVLKDLRKQEKTYKGQIKQVELKVIESLKLSDDVGNSVSIYVTSCVELCWLSAIQDPPVYLEDPDLVKSKPFNKQLYREYTVRGDVVEYVLWPAMLICENGGVLKKGVAQGR